MDIDRADELLIGLHGKASLSGGEGMNDNHGASLIIAHSDDCWEAGEGRASAHLVEEMTSQRKRLRAAILTAVQVETRAIRPKLHQLRTFPDVPGVVLYETGVVDTNPVLWDVALLETGQDNEEAGVLTERIIRDWHPHLIIYFGVAGRLKDAEHGDIVVGTGAYPYARGKETKEGFFSRPAPLPTTERFKSVAKHLRDHHRWRSRIARGFHLPPPNVHIGPIASGPKILEDEESETVREVIRKRYNDALAVDKESAGFLTAIRLNDVDGGVVRAISDALSDKQQADSAGGQDFAARRGAAFVIASMELYGRWFTDGIDLSYRSDYDQLREVREALARMSAQARTALQPYLLPPVTRTFVAGALLPAVTNSFNASQARVIPIIAPAGYGKSTALGQLHDALASMDDVASCLFRCDDIPTGGIADRDLPMALGLAATGLPVSLQDVVAVLSETAKHAVLLVDTLDLVLSPGIRAPLRRLLLTVADQRATLVLTCRDFDYRLHLEPPGASLPGVEVDRHTIPPFSSDEIRAGAEGFLRGLQPQPDEATVRRFVDQLLQLAVDRRPVLELVSCPLLLALVCESYGREAKLPADLSVTMLYDTHWDRQVLRGRGAEAASRGQHREQFSLALARACFVASAERLQDTMDATDIALPAGTPADVGDDLLSSNVLQQPQSGRLRFFHQTFLEYAVARWLGASSQRSELRTFLARLARGAHTPWWPMVRQLITRCSSGDDVREVVGILDLHSLPAFRAAAFGVCARPDGSALTALAEHAAASSPEFRITLLEALAGVPLTLQQQAWTIATSFASDPDSRVRGAVTQTLGAVLGQSGETQSRMLADLFDLSDPDQSATS
jgi:nucleoside phosphorylase